MDDTVFVDTNVFLRFFVNDVAAQYEKARALFEAAETGKIKLETSELVIAEIVWVLESFYGFSRKEVTEVLSTLLSSRNLKIASHARITEAVRLYAAGNMDFIDAYNIAYVRSKEYSKVATFDSKHFKKVDGISIV
ncbi:MAG: type II toxin-antitoxin system VapC family toxin [Nitrospiraceae bacterium]|nr:type II toxin-antitoxin system VapC family toxin [Nitrospiraceae bacterium]